MITFRSKVDTWLVVVATLPLMVGLVTLAMGPWIPAAVLTGAGLFSLWVLFSTTYDLTADRLVARSAFWRWQVPLHTIRNVYETRNPLSAPAASLDRIGIVHDGGLLLVSPREKAAFIAALRRAAPVLGTDPSATARAMERSHRSLRRVVIGVVVVQVAVGLAIAVGVYIESRPPRVTVTADRVSVASGLWSHDIAREDIRFVRLEPALPAVVRRVSGFSTGNVLRGQFDVATFGRSHLFIDRRTPPFLVIHERAGYTVINFDDASRTRALLTDLGAAPPVYGVEF